MIRVFNEARLVHRDQLYDQHEEAQRLCFTYSVLQHGMFSTKLAWALNVPSIVVMECRMWVI